MYDRGLSEEQRMMRQSCRDFVDDVVLPYIKQNWQKEWSMVPEERLPLSHPGRRREDRHPHAGRAGRIRRRRAREGHRGAHLRAGRRGNRARRFRSRRQAGAELESLGAAAPVRAQAFAGEMVQAAGRGAAIPDGALPDRAARRLRPLAALQRAGSGDADQGGQDRRRLGDQRPQAVHLQRLRRHASTSSTPTPIRKSACCRARRRSWCRARPRASRSRAATRRSAAAS